jgi:hypothetical protein
MNIPFRLYDEASKPLEYVAIPARELKIIQTKLNLDTFVFASDGPEPRHAIDEDLAYVTKASHAFIHFQYPGNDHWHSQVIVDISGDPGWRYRSIINFPKTK